MNKPGVYILISGKNSRYYIGSTIDFDRRFEEHCNGLVKATKNLRPLSQVFFQEFESIRVARQVEYKLKKCKSRIIVESIIRDGNIKFIQGQ